MLTHNWVTDDLVHAKSFLAREEAALFSKILLHYNLADPEIYLWVLLQVLILIQLQLLQRHWNGRFLVEVPKEFQRPESRNSYLVLQEARTSN